MRKKLNINGTIISADTGETLVDAALAAKILIPHDCATGQCETCRVRIPWGSVNDNGTAYGDTVLACQARVKDDATITFETTPPLSTVKGQIESVRPLSQDVAEITIRTKEPPAYRPGQYAKLTFDGYPPREYSYSAPMHGEQEADTAVFQIRRLSNGKVSSVLGNAISVGHNVKVSGPYGSAYLREQDTGPIVLASSGTGFAPIWSLARAVTRAEKKRPVSIVVGAKTPQDIYMIPAFRWLKERGAKDISIATRVGATGRILDGTADEYLPPLGPQSVVHVAGNPAVVNNTKNIALSAGAICYADPFTPSEGKQGFRGIFEKLRLPSDLFHGLSAR